MKKILGLCLGIGISTQVFAAFNREEAPSINGTGQVLKQGKGEVGFATFSYGLTDQVQISVPTLGLVAGAIGVSGSYKHDVKEGMWLTPSLGTGFNLSTKQLSASGVLTAGFNAGERSTVSLGLAYSFVGEATVSSSTSAEEESSLDKVTTAANGVAGTFEYDMYTLGGNLFYVGVVGGSAIVVPYLGFTWAWENFHLGIVSSLASLFVPLPYLYWRF